MILTLFMTIAVSTLTALPAFANAGGSTVKDLTGTLYGIIALVLFVAAYGLVIFEEQLHLRKSKPVIVAAGIIWVLVAIAYKALGEPDAAHGAILHNLTEYAELFLFLLAAMTYINAMEERNVFNALRSWLVTRGFTLRTLFWMTGFLAFVISPVADNLTTALLMGAVSMAVGGANRPFVVVACINIVVGANAGGGLFTLRRHHDAHGLAEGEGGLCRVLRHLYPVPDQLVDPGGHHELCRAEGAAPGGRRNGPDEAGGQTGHGALPGHHRHGGLVP